MTPGGYIARPMMRCWLSLGLLLVGLLCLTPVAMASPATVCTADPVFAPIGPAGSVFSTLAWDDGSGDAVYAAGQFGAADAAKANFVAKWDGNQWLPIGEGFNGVVNDLVVWNDGTGEALYATGRFSRVGSMTASNLARWDGIEWQAIPGTLGLLIQGTALAVFNDGHGEALYLAGSVSTPGGNYGIAKWDGALWSFIGDSQLDNKVLDLEVWDDSSGEGLYIAGDFTGVDGITASFIARWDGMAWSNLTGSMGEGLSNTGQVLLGTPEGLYVGGRFTMAGGNAAQRLARWDGGAWNIVPGVFGEGVNGFVHGLYRWDDGSGPALYVGGQFNAAGGAATVSVARHQNGNWSALEGTVFTSPVDRIHSFLAWDDGQGERLLVAGTFSHLVDRYQASGVTTWTGTTWTHLDRQAPTGRGMQTGTTVYDVVVWDDGGGPAVYAGGDFLWAGGVKVNRVGRWNGTSWTSLDGPADGPGGVGMDATVRRLAVWDDGGGPALYVGGEFTTAGGANIRGLAKWDGTVWSEVSAGAEVAGSVMALTTWDDGSGETLYVGGEFSTIGGATMNNVARWDGTAWSSIGPNGNPGLRLTVSDLQPWTRNTGEVLVASGTGSGPAGAFAGSMPTWNGIEWNHFNGNGNPEPRGETTDLLLWDDGTGESLYVAGDFDDVGPGTITEATNLARWDGTAWSRVPDASLNGADDRIDALTVWDDGAGDALYVGGSFTRAGAQTVDGLARWSGQEWSAVHPDGIDGILPVVGNANGETYSVHALEGVSATGFEGLFMGGRYNLAGGTPSASITLWQCVPSPANIFAADFESGDLSEWPIVLSVQW